MDSHLDRLAKEHGISLTRPSPENVEVPIADDVKRKVLAALGVAVDSGPRTPVRRSATNHSSEKIIPRSFLPELLEKDRVWGISLQLYELRSERNWGIGDFEDLVEMIRFAASLGADFVGLNPLHAPFLADPDWCSPYEPSNRQMLNPLYIAVDKITGFERTPELDARLQELRSNDLVEYVRVAETKLAVLRDLWASWRSSSDIRRVVGKTSLLSSRIAAKSCGGTRSSKRCQPSWADWAMARAGNPGRRSISSRKAQRLPRSPPNMKRRSNSTCGCNGFAISN